MAGPWPQVSQSWLCVLFLHAPSALAQNPPVTIAVDANVNRRPIDPNIYGVAHASTRELNDLNSPLNRNGGNNTTRYNWQLNADNRGNDWYFESIADSSATAGRARRHLHRQRARRRRAGDADDSDDRAGSRSSAPIGRKLASFSIAKYGAQTGNDWQWFPDAGNGVRDQRPASSPATIRTTPTSRRRRPSSRAGCSTSSAAGAPTSAGGLRYYILDNEPSIWHSTHRDVHPTAPTMDEIRDKMIDFAHEDQGRRSDGARRRTRGVGLERLLLQRLRPAVRQPARLGLAARPRQPRRTPTTCRGCSTRCASDSTTTASACSTSSPSTTTRRAASSATTSRPRCSCGATARRARCGIRTTSTRPGSTTRCSSSRGCKSWVDTYYPGTQHRHHRIQLGRREPHQRRDDAGRHPRHLRPRGARPGARAGRRPRRARRPTRR